MEFCKNDFEFLRTQAQEKFNVVRGDWIDAGVWAAPHRVQWMQSMLAPGARQNRHIVDTTHLIARQSYVAGFMEGNTSSTREWFKILSNDPDANMVPENRAWLQAYTRRCHSALNRSNFYNAAATFYDDYALFNNGTYFIEEIDGDLFWHILKPGSYYLINDSRGESVVLVREYQMNVKSIVDQYGRKNKSGSVDWTNISKGVQKMYEEANYGEMIDIITVICENKNFDPNALPTKYNKKWVTVTYEGGASRQAFTGEGHAIFAENAEGREKGRQEFLNITASKRKPFIAGRSNGGTDEYGPTGPTYQALGLIKSLNKKAIGKDRALEQMLAPALQGPANLRKSYITNAANSYIPLDAQTMAQTKGQGLRSVFEVNPGIGTLIQDVSDLRNQVERLYFADYLMYLSRNPKTRTAAETNAVVNEQQLIIGPNLQSLNWTHNNPVVELTMDFVLDMDPYLPEIPQGLAGKFTKIEYVSVFAQSQKAADIPQIRAYFQNIAEAATAAGPVGMKVWDKFDFDKYQDILADRYYLPEGLNKDQGKVDAERQQNQAMAQKQQMMNETLPAMAGAAKDLGIQAPGAQGVQK